MLGLDETAYRKTNQKKNVSSVLRFYRYQVKDIFLHAASSVESLF